VKDVLSCFSQQTLNLQEELYAKIEEMLLGLQALTTSLIADTKKYLHEELASGS
jgi:hypothetical protein